MENKILLSFAIPTWNRAKNLNNLLVEILSQIEGFQQEIEICISNNGSTDNTREVVMNFKNKYPDLVKYNENEKNLGFDLNLLKAIEMSNGEFIWTFGDDDLIVEGGIKEIIQLIKKNTAEKTGLIFIRREAYVIDKKTGKKIICCNTVDKGKSEIFNMDKKDVIGMYSPDPGFMTVLLLNGAITKGIIKEDISIIEDGIGINFIHVLLQSIMFLKYPYLQALSLNKVVIFQELPTYKFFIEGMFKLDYMAQKRLNNLLLSCKYINDDYRPLLIGANKKLIKNIVFSLIKMRALESFNYYSYFRCLKLFFQYSPIFDALIFSFIFSVLFLFPPTLLQVLYKIFLVAKYGKEWKGKWILAYDSTKGSREWDFTSEAQKR